MWRRNSAPTLTDSNEILRACYIQTTRPQILTKNRMKEYLFGAIFIATNVILFIALMWLIVTNLTIPTLLLWLVVTFCVDMLFVGLADFLDV